MSNTAQAIKFKFIPNGPQRGDLLGMAYSNSIEPGVFTGYGQGTVQFYSLKVADWQIANNRQLSKGYMGGGSVGDRVIALDPNCLPTEMKAAYDYIKAQGL